MPRFTTWFGTTSSSPRRAMILRSSISIVFKETGVLISEVKPGLYSVMYDIQWFSGFATTTPSTSVPGILTSRGFKLFSVAIRST